MISSEIVLINLSKHAQNKEYTFHDLYRILYNPQMYIKAYSSIYKNDGSSTSGTDDTKADGFSEIEIDKLIDSMKKESYQPKPARRTYIPKKNGDKRPLGIPSFNDRIIQEIVRMIIEEIYEPMFSEHSHGFRPNRSCHTALNEIRNNYTGCSWFIEGDIKGFFDNIDHHALNKILRKKIKDERFIRLIWKFLRAGYIEKWKYNKTYSGTPQGGIISPILANIYLNELDQYMIELKEEYDTGDRKKDQVKNPVYRNLEYKASELKKKINTCDNEEERELLLRQHKEIMKEKCNTVYIVDNGKFKRLNYTRYADDFIIGIHGSKKDSEEIKEKVRTFLDETLKLELSVEKTLITNSNDRAKFLGYEITVNNNDRAYKNENGVKVRNARRNVRLFIPENFTRDICNDRNMVKDVNSKDWNSLPRLYLTNLSDLEIVSVYNAEIRGLYNYYKMADNVSGCMWKIHHIMQFSCLKTLARKHKSSVAKEIKKHQYGKNWGMPYQTQDGQKVRYFYNQGFKIDRYATKESKVDNKAETTVYMGVTELERRIKAKSIMPRLSQRYSTSEHVRIDML